MLALVIINTKGKNNDINVLQYAILFVSLYCDKETKSTYYKRSLTDLHTPKGIKITIYYKSYIGTVTIIDVIQMVRGSFDVAY